MDAKEWFQLGRTSMEAGNIEEAIEAFNQATALDPSSFEAWWSLASACNLFGTEIEGTGDYSRANMYKVKAAYSYGRAIRADPSNPDAAQAKIFAETIRSAQQRKKEQGLFE